MRALIVFIAKLVGKTSRLLRLGAGVTWAGEIALRLDRNLLSKLIPPGAKIILVAGTNGKTTTTKLICHMLGNAGHNPSGANLLNGIVGSLIQSSPSKNYVFEVDEATLPIVLAQIAPTTIVLLNLFRDQLDRYGEVDTIANKWRVALRGQNLVVNADDPALAWVARNYRAKFFGLGDKKYFLPKMQHATDSIFCPNCGQRLVFSGVYFSHLGEYACKKCGFSHPKLDISAKEIKSPLPGIYNLYNVMAAALATGVRKEIGDFSPAFGRSEKIGQARILLSKNPAGFNESLRTVINSQQKGPILLALNDRIPDGRDVSWIWDGDFEMLQEYKHPIFVSGDRKFDLALRLKYAEVPCTIKHELNVSWILATYSAMLEIRKELTGRKIL